MQPAADGGSWEHATDDEYVVTGQDPAAAPGAALGTQARYVLTHGELEAGASGAAAPLLGVPGVEGSVGVVMLAESVPERVGLRVVEAATEVADALR
jgi:DNA-binding IclR family transcriptional regulator